MWLLDRDGMTSAIEYGQHRIVAASLVCTAVRWADGLVIGAPHDVCRRLLRSDLNGRSRGS